MTEQTNAPAELANRCGHPTASGPCYRPAGHPATGHMSKATRDAKDARARGKDVTPEALRAAEAARAAKAAERIAAAEAAIAAKVERYTAELAALGYKVTPMTKAEKTAAAKPAAE